MRTVVTMIDSLAPENLGGGERLAALIAMSLPRERWRSVLCTTRPSRGDFHDEVGASGVELLELNRSGKTDARAWRRLVAFLRSERVDVLHAHKFGSNLWASVLGRAARVPVVLAHEHSWSYEGQPLRRFLDREVIARFSDRLLAVSQEDLRRMHSVERVRSGDASFMPIGIPPLPEPTRDLRAELGIAAGAPVIGTVCALRPEKALGVLVEATARLRPSFPELRVLIGGTGPEAEPVRAAAVARGVEEAVVLLGYVGAADVAALMAAVDVAVNTSDREGSPLSVMEAMAAGRPVVATAVGGTPDLVTDGVHGLLVPPRRPDALADAVGRLLHDPDERARMGAAARERQQAEFTLDALVARLERLYEDLLSEKGR